MHDLKIFILVYNRCNVIPTLNVLKKCGVQKDDIYLVVGNDDPQFNSVVQNFNDYNVLEFDKQDVADAVDSIGSYRNTLKLCTYARVFIDDYAKQIGLKYVCIIFDDIKSIKYRYIDNGVVRSVDAFNLPEILKQYIELLNCNDNVYMVGPPGSSAYIGCKPESMYKVPTHYANMLIYSVNKPIGPYSANVLEDMTIILNNSIIGHIGLFPMGVQINCRDAGATDDAYCGISIAEYLQQYAIMTRTQINPDNIKISYVNFIPKILSEKFRKEDNQCG